MLFFPAALVAALVAFAVEAGAATFVVNNTGSSGAGSLHQAITDANLTAAADVIEFNIQTIASVKTIGGTLPAITQPLTIDGYTQGSASPNTVSERATNADIRIELDAAGVIVGGAMLRINAGPTVIRGIAIKGIKAKGGVGIEVGAAVDAAADAVVAGCFVGTNAAGNVDASAGTGIRVLGSATIGTPDVAGRNLISGNNAAGIDARGVGVVITNNLIGLAANGVFFLANGNGISIPGTTADKIAIGSKAIGSANVIAGNSGDGVSVLDTVPGSVTILRNSFRDNGDLGIDLGADGVTGNDDGDLDIGANSLQNFPVLTFARMNEGKLTIEGYLQSAFGTYTVDFFVSDAADDSGFGEGELAVGTTSVAVPDEGDRTAFFRETDIVVPPGFSLPFVVTAVAIDDDGGRTSEFSLALEALDGGAELFVTNSNDSGTGSLRQAILDANANADTNTIVFGIPQPVDAIPTDGSLVIEHPLIIDGFTQNKCTPNTIVDPTNTKLAIEIDGSAGSIGSVCLRVNASGTIIRGLAIHSCPAGAIRSQDAEGLRIEGNFIGLDANGIVAPGNGGSGIVTLGNGGDVAIGGESFEQRNVIAGSLNFGIVVSGTPALIAGNVIGLNALGEKALGNGVGGIRVAANDSVVGSDNPFFGNQIQDNRGAGIEVLNSSGTEILANSIFDNDGVGIDLDPSDSPGVTDNDGVEDADNGANARQDFPVLEFAKLAGGGLTIAGTLHVPDATVDATYTIRVFASSQCDPTEHGEGGSFVGVADVVLSGDDEKFEFILPVDGLVGPVLTATATDRALRNTSEFSRCFPDASPPDQCGDANGNGTVIAGDAFQALAAAVGTGECLLCRCDVNDSGEITAPDALLILKAAVGQDVTLVCPACD